MIVLSNLTAQTLQPGQSITFDNVKHKSGCGECFNKQVPNSVKLRANGDYDISFSGNIAGTVAGDVVQIAIAAGGFPLLETGMNSISAAAGDLHNVSTTTVYRNCCCDTERLSVINTGTTPVTIAPNSAFVIQRRS